MDSRTGEIGPPNERQAGISQVDTNTAAIGATSWAGPVKITTDEHGLKRFVVHGKEFAPVGVNYLISHDGPPYKTFDMFDTKDFKLSEIDSDLREIADDGFNFVRLWLKGLDHDQGFSLGPYRISDAHVDNVVAAIHKAQEHGLKVVLTGTTPANIHCVLPCAARAVQQHPNVCNR